MRIPLQSRTTKVFLLGGCILLSAVYVGFSAVDFLGAHFAENPTLASLSRAVRLQPRNAEYQYRLGRYLSLAELSPAQAEAPFRAAVALNPHQARYWMALAGTYQSLGDDQQQGRSLERALAAERQDVAAIHLELARLYDALVNEPAIRPTLHIAIPKSLSG